ncbi:kinase-like domain-containing protein [Glomus cerebriforme]|uniref:Kinase-like domain-containing protein n=1 Tax=Glomus cerebriforme TaxID=658196 RepID=A0A397SU58_9GLOM|nr:kinase-like domain-containing protein [Glomus cerebriforme]
MDWLMRDEKRPKPNSYMMVMMWAKDGDLIDYINKKAHSENFTWYKRLEILEELSNALQSIHMKEMIHRDLHCGNILMDDMNISQFPAISDLGLCGNYNKTGKLIGVLPFIAPEHLKEPSRAFTTASDIYSFGIIMWVICCCKLPYEEYKDDQHLALSIISEFRPEIPKDTPKAYAELMKRCWDDDPEKRPKSLELRKMFLRWQKQYYSNNNEFSIAEKERLRKIKNSDLSDVPKNQEIKRSKIIYDFSEGIEGIKTIYLADFENQDNPDNNPSLIYI